ncbi:MAG: cyclic nucleotide-binding domain-containing protein [Polyangiaceae bacterium]|jgi:serine/threonine-protein kinase
MVGSGDEWPHDEDARSHHSVTRTIETEQVDHGRSAHSEPLDEATPPGLSLDCDKFVERGVLGHGGSGVVIRAFDKTLLRDVAIKILNPDFSPDSDELTRFAEEARIAGQLEHPNIVPVYEFGLDRCFRRFLCMKLVEGETLEAALKGAGEERLCPERLANFLQVLVKMCDAVSFAHSRGVIHRDLKPTNVMISDFGQVYVLDWGIAILLTRSSQHVGQRVRLGTEGQGATRRGPEPLLGTTCYMAPEQLQGRADMLDERTDVFALGGTLYQILTGRPPLDRRLISALRGRSGDLPTITPPDQVLERGALPSELCAIAMRALAYEPSERYASVQDFQRAIENFQRGAWATPRVTFPAGSVIVTDGEPGDEAYVVLEGRCAAYRVDGGEEVELRVMGPGEVFGETAVFSNRPRTASVKAVTDVVLLSVTRETLSNAVGLHSWMGAFVRALADRFRETDARLRVLESRNAGSARG